MDEKKETVWITGASSGIGYSLATKLLAEGKVVIATARDISKFESLIKLYDKTLFCYSVDVRNEESVKNFCFNLEQQSICLDTMILNAGICKYINWPDLDLDIIHRNMNTNFWGVLHCIKYGIKLLSSSERPYIVAISSASHIVGLPRAEGYGTSKAALHYFLEALQVQLYKTKIDLTIVTPGFVATELTAKNDFPMPFILSVDKATNIILKGMKKRKLEIKFPIAIIVILQILNIIPTKLKIWILAKMVRPK